MTITEQQVQRQTEVAGRSFTSKRRMTVRAVSAALAALLALPLLASAAQPASATTQASSDDGFVIDFGAATRPVAYDWFQGAGGLATCNRTSNTVSVTANAMSRQFSRNSAGRYLVMTSQRYVSVGYQVWVLTPSSPNRWQRVANVGTTGYRLGVMTKANTFRVPNGSAVAVIAIGAVWNGSRWVSMAPTYIQQRVCVT